MVVLKCGTKKQKNYLGEFHPVTGERTGDLLKAEDGEVKMVHGTRFIQEYSQINELLEKLYFKEGTRSMVY